MEQPETQSAVGSTRLLAGDPTLGDVIEKIAKELYLGKTVTAWDGKPLLVKDVQVTQDPDGVEITLWDCRLKDVKQGEARVTWIRYWDKMLQPANGKTERQPPTAGVADGKNL